MMTAAHSGCRCWPALRPHADSVIQSSMSLKLVGSDLFDQAVPDLWQGRETDHQIVDRRTVRYQSSAFSGRRAQLPTLRCTGTK